MARHALKRFVSPLIFLFAFVLILRSVAFADSAEVRVVPDRVRVGDEFTLEGTVFASDIAGVSVGATLSVCGERSCRFQCGGGCYQGQCSALISASGPVRACPASAPNGLNFFAYDLPGGGPVFDSGSQFRITYTVLPGSRSGRYNAAIGVRHLRGDTEQFITTYTIEDEINVNITALPTQIFPLGLGFTPTVSNLHVAVTDDQGKPVTSPEQLRFVVSTMPFDTFRRGGHAHIGNRTLGGIGVLSSCAGSVVRSIILTGDVQDTATFQETTDSNGELCMRYIADEPGGEIKIQAFPAANQDNFAIINVRVPDLVLLPGNSQFYSKLGGTRQHPGPPDNPELDMNHWGRPDIVAAFPQIAQTYYDMFEHFVIWVNDMSLPKGGVFDINGTWVPPHVTHRRGTEMDLVSCPPLRNCDIGIPIENRLDLERIVQEHSFPNALIEIHSPGEQNQHFHIYFSGR